MKSSGFSFRHVGRPYYIMRPRLWREDLRMLDRRMMVSHRWRYVYVRMPKAANSTTVRTLLDWFPDAGSGLDDIEAAKKAMPSFRSLSWAETFAVRGYFAFTVVRNPYTRILAAFLDKIRPGSTHHATFGPRIAAMNGGSIDFRGFCRYLAAGGWADNAHWTPQTRLLALADRIDEIGRVETLGDDLARIGRRIGAGRAAAVRTDGPPATGATARMQSHYDDETGSIVATVYRDDFERFGYDPTRL